MNSKRAIMRKHLLMEFRGVIFFRQPGKSGHVTNIRLAKSRKNTNYHVTSLRRTKGL